MSTLSQNRFDPGRTHVSLSNFKTGSDRVIILGQAFPVLKNGAQQLENVAQNNYRKHNLTERNEGLGRKKRVD